MTEINENTNLVSEVWTDKDIIDFMKESKSVKDWNSRRDQVKSLRDQSWITINLDASKLIVTLNIH